MASPLVPAISSLLRTMPAASLVSPLVSCLSIGNTLLWILFKHKSYLWNGGSHFKSRSPYHGPPTPHWFSDLFPFRQVLSLSVAWPPSCLHTYEACSASGTLHVLSPLPGSSFPRHTHILLAPVSSLPIWLRISEVISNPPDIKV